MRLKSPPLHRPTRRDFLLGATALAATALLLDITEINPHHLTVLEHTFHLPALPPAFHGFRIAQISDFHRTHTADDTLLQRTVARVNALRPDMVALTGDFISANQHDPQQNLDNADRCAAILSALQCPLRFCSLGNHDSIDFQGVTDALARHGLPVLRNRYTSLDLRGDRLWIGGLADAYFDAPDLTRSIPRQPAGAPVFLLGHEPDIADTINAYGGVDLLLAGHTHGGQVRLPGLTSLFLPDMGHKYIHGPFTFSRLQLYVNRGIGTVHLPIRFRCPPEITILTLQPA